VSSAVSALEVVQPLFILLLDLLLVRGLLLVLLVCRVRILVTAVLLSGIASRDCIVGLCITALRKG